MSSHVPSATQVSGCRQQQYQMQGMQALGAQEVQWAQAPERGQTTGALDVKELPYP